MNKVVKIVVAAIALVSAVGITWYSFGGAKEAAAAKSDETKVLWMCSACSEPFDLTTKEVQDLATASGGVAPYACPKCKEKAMYRAVRCSKCQTAFIAVGPPNATGKCPKCEPEAKPLPPPTEDEAAPTDEQAPEEQADPTAPKRVKKKIRAG